MSTPLEEPVTIAVIPVFHPPDDLVTRVQALVGETAGVVLVDDGSAALSPANYDGSTVDVISLETNTGIAGALNVGVSRARERGATHLLILDQDSQIESGYLAAAHEALAAHERGGSRPVAVVPETVEGIRVTVRRDGTPFDPIQSGQLMVVSALDEVGEFDARLVIDAVDSEYTLRARSRGLEFFVVPDSRLGHELGEPSPLLVFGRHLSVLGKKRYRRYHRPSRTYYMVRNGLSLWYLHRRGNLGWLLHRTAYLTMDVLFNAVTAPDRWTQFAAIARGVADAVRGRLGPMRRSDHSRGTAQGT